MKRRKHPQGESSLKNKKAKMNLYDVWFSGDGSEHCEIMCFTVKARCETSAIQKAQKECPGAEFDFIITVK